MPEFRIRHPDGRVFNVRDAPSEEEAQRHVTRLIDEEQRAAGPQEDNRPLQGIGPAFVQGARSGLGGGVQGLGALGEQFGVPGAGSVRDLGNWITGNDPRNPTSDSPTRGVELRDFATQPLRAVGSLGGEVAGNLLGLFGGGFGAGLATRGAARLAGAGAGAAANAGRVATVAGIAGSGTLAGIPELEGALIQEGVSPERALQLAALVGPVIGAGEVAGPIALLNRALRRQVSQATAQAIVAAGARRSVGREVAIGAGTEALSEAAGDAARQGVIAAETGNLDLGRRAEQVALGAIGGALGGGAMGVPLGVARHSRAQSQVAADAAAAPAPAVEVPEEPERAPPIPPPPPAFTTVEEAQAFARREGGEGRAPVDLVADPDGYVAWANSLQEQNYNQAVERQRGNEVSRFIGANKISYIRSSEKNEDGTSGDPETNLQVQRDVLYRNLIKAAGQGNLDLNNFSVDDVVRQALAPLEVDDPTPNERGFVRDTLNNLVQEGLLLRGDRGKWRIKPLDTGALEAQEWERQKAAQQKPPTPTEPTLSELDEERRKMRANYPELLRLEDEAQRSQELKDFLATPDAKAFLLDMLKDQTTPGASYRTWQKAFKAETGIDLTPEQGGLLHTAAKQLGLVNQLNQIDGRILAKAKAAQSVVQWRQFLADSRLASVLNGMLLGTKLQNMSAKAWQSLFAEAGIPLSQQQATELNAAAQRAGVTNKLGMLMQPPAPLQVAVGPQPTPKTKLPVAPAVTTPPPGEPEVPATSPENVQALKDSGALGSEISEFYRRPAEFGRMVREALAGYIWWSGQKVLASQEILDQAKQRLKNAQAEALEWYNKIDAAFESRSADTRLANILGSDSPAMTKAQHRAWVKDRLTNTEATIARIERQMARQGLTPAAAPTESTPAPTPKATKKTKADKPDVRESAAPQGWGEVEVDPPEQLTPEGFAALKEVLRKLVGPRAVLQLGSMGRRHGKTDGVSIGPLVRLAYDIDAKQALGVLHHEAIHALRRLGLITDAEWQTLLRASRSNKWRQNFGVEARWGKTYAGRSNIDAILDEEAVAEAFKLWSIRNASQVDTAAGRIFQKVHRFLTKLRNALQGLGFQDADSIFERISAGEMGQRPAKSTTSISARAANKRLNRAYGADPTQTLDSPEQMQTTQNSEARFSVPSLPTAPAAAKAVTARLLGDQITGTMKWLASPITTMPALRPALKAAADVLHALAARRSQALQNIEESLTEFLKLSPEAQTRVTRAWEKASRDQKTPAYAAMDPKEASALKQLVSGPQRALDFYIESAAWQHFDPEAAKTPQQKAKLEAFWKKHEGKHLWEIPEAERRAASPNGATAMAEMERLRNKFYMPMIAQGSHFVAAYPADAKGQKLAGSKPIRMYAFTPRNGFQRMMGYEDPHARAVAELQREYGGKAKFAIQAEPTQFNSDAEAHAIREKGDFISQYLTKLSEVSGMKTAEAQRVLARMTDQLNKAQMERIFRPNQDILRPITNYNEGSYVMDVMPRYFAGMASVAAKRHTQESWARAIAPLSINDKAYLNDLRDYATTPTEAYGGLRTLAFVWLMGFAPDTAFVNALQVVQVTAPMMIRDGGVGAMKHINGAYGLVLKQLGTAIRNRDNVAKHFVDGLTDPGEIKAVKQALEVGTMSPLYTDESKGQVTVEGMRGIFGNKATKAAAKINSAVRAAGQLQQSAEQLNRMITFLAAYRIAKANPGVIAKSNRFNNTNIDAAKPDAAYQYATKMVQDTQYVTTKEDRAYFQRFTPGAELMTQFMSFPAKTVELFARHFLKVLPGAMKEDPAAARAGALGFMLMMAPMIGLAGVWSLPFAESLREIFEKIIGLAWGSTQNFDADMKRWLGGGTMAEFLTRGGPHAANIVSLSRRLAIDPVPYQEMTTTSALSLLGPAASIPEAYARAAERAKHGDYMNMLALMLPRAAGNVVRGADLMVGTEEYRSDKGRTLVSQEQLDRMAGDLMMGRAGIAGRQAFGFQTPSVTNARDRVLRTEEVDRQNLRATESLNSEVARHLTEGMRLQQQGKASDAQREFNAMSERLLRNARRNQEFVQEGRYDLLVQPNMSAIQRRAREDLLGLSDPDVIAQRTGPTRRFRAMDEAQLYP